MLMKKKWTGEVLTLLKIICGQKRFSITPCVGERRMDNENNYKRYPNKLKRFWQNV